MRRKAIISCTVEIATPTGPVIAPAVSAWPHAVPICRHGVGKNIYNIINILSGERSTTGPSRPPLSPFRTCSDRPTKANFLLFSKGFAGWMRTAETRVCCVFRL